MIFRPGSYKTFATKKIRLFTVKILWKYHKDQDDIKINMNINVSLDVNLNQQLEQIDLNDKIASKRPLIKMEQNKLKSKLS